MRLIVNDDFPPFPAGNLPLAEQPKVSCPRCGTDWVVRVRRRRWERILHHKKSKFLCEQCHKKFFTITQGE